MVISTTSLYSGCQSCKRNQQLTKKSSELKTKKKSESKTKKDPKNLLKEPKTNTKTSWTP